MCGIIGVIKKKDDSFDDIVKGLMALQHRGQDACGIATYSDANILLRKELDSVKRVFLAGRRAKLRGRAGIGHTRYPTQGEEKIADAQPIVIETDPQVAIALNGNTVNYYELRNALRKRQVKLKTKVDTEIIALIFAKNYQRYGDFFRAASEIMKKIQGAYSITGIIAGKGLFALRDPNGIRPLVLGKKGRSYMFASETIALKDAGYRFEREIAPGEAVLISEDLKVSHRIIQQRKRAPCMFEGVYFSSPDSMMGNKSIRELRRELGTRLAPRVDTDIIDMVVPVPSGGIAAAEGLAKAAGLPLKHGLKRDKTIPRTFIMPSQKIRETASRLKYQVDWKMLEDRDVCLVDDSIVRGTTSRRLVRALRSGGVNEITLVSSCPPVRFPCHYGINMSTKKELLAANRNIHQIRRYLHADEVIYLRVADLKHVFGDHICTACLTGHYPVEISRAQMRKLGMQRALQANRLNLLYSQIIKKLMESTEIADRYRTREIVRMDLPYMDLLLVLHVRWYRKWSKKLLDLAHINGSAKKKGMLKRKRKKGPVKLG
ncbi:amidophosphoribosyltransferase [Candidatus Woesearchaeota archaeon]|nr:amidophosphoribosyltransferase [Candidatus Woesearchaeota archaeon]